MSKGKWQSGDTFDVTGEGQAEERKREREAEPLVNTATNFKSLKRGSNGQWQATGAGDDQGDPATFPAIYGVDMQRRKMQAIKSDIARGQFGGDQKAGSLGAFLGDRQVMLSDEDVSWIIAEQDRMGLIAKDLYFERSAAASGLFETPQGLKYLREIKPDYFEKREKLVRWVAGAQLKLFDIRFNGIQTQQDFDFMYMLQGLDASQKKLLGQPVWMLNKLAGLEEGPSYQPGIFAKPRSPRSDQIASFAGMGSRNGTGVGLNKPQGFLAPWGWSQDGGIGRVPDMLQLGQ